MKKYATLTILLTVLIPTFQCSTPASDEVDAAFREGSEYTLRNERIRREDSFFGIHFDLHAREEDSLIGATLTRGMIDSLLIAVKPDYVQVDCKGHPGISSYPTEVGFRAAGYVGDPLQLWREVTDSHHVALYMHFSGIYDQKVVQEHPGWAVINADGSRSDRILSPFSPYDSIYLIPQLKELAVKYRVDGAWVDGECWAYSADYSPEALAEFTRRTGIRDIPRDREDAYFFDFMEYQRTLFREHVSRYLEQVHAEYPDFQITSNWAFSSMMPEEVSLDLDFLSGDLTPGNAVNRAAFEARCMAAQGMPWDLMAWSFTWDPSRQLPNQTKTALQLQQELAEVMAMGGGVQVYFKQNRDISIQPWTIPVMAEIAQFCRDRQPWCQDAVPVPQVGILYSGHAYRKGLTRVYPGWDEAKAPLIGLNTALLDGQFCTTILLEHQLKETGGEYPLIVLPEWDLLAPGVKEFLLSYAENGGNLLLIGTGPVAYFAEAVGISEFNFRRDQNVFIRQGERLFNHQGDMIELTTSRQPLMKSRFYEINDLRWPSVHPSAIIHDFGSGKIGMINFDLGTLYYKGSNYLARDFLSHMVRRLMGDPLVTLSGSNLVHMSLNSLDGSLLVHLINTAGKHSDDSCLGLDEIPAIEPVEVTIRSDSEPGSVLLHPGSAKVKYRYKDEKIHIVIPRFELYSIIEIR